LSHSIGESTTASGAGYGFDEHQDGDSDPQMSSHDDEQVVDAAANSVGAGYLSQQNIQQKEETRSEDNKDDDEEQDDNDRDDNDRDDNDRDDRRSEVLLQVDEWGERVDSRMGDDKDEAKVDPLHTLVAPKVAKLSESELKTSASSKSSVSRNDRRSRRSRSRYSDSRNSGLRDSGSYRSHSQMSLSRRRHRATGSYKRRTHQDPGRSEDDFNPDHRGNNDRRRRRRKDDDGDDEDDNDDRSDDASWQVPLNSLARKKHRMAMGGGYGPSVGHNPFQDTGAYARERGEGEYMRKRLKNVPQEERVDARRHYDRKFGKVKIAMQQCMHSKKTVALANYCAGARTPMTRLATTGSEDDLVMEAITAENRIHEAKHEMV